MSEHTVLQHQIPERKSGTDGSNRSGIGQCPACGNARNSDAAYCPACGHAAAAQIKPPPAPELTLTGQSGRTSEEALFGTKPSDDRLLLPLVGPNAPGSTQKAPRACVCGAELAQDASFCHRCGLSVGQQQARPRLVQRGAEHTPLTADLVDEGLTIGKEPGCGLIIPTDEYVSRRHARLSQANGMIFLEDLGSSNGTFLRIRRPIVLEDGDEIVVGTSIFRFETGPARKDSPCQR